MFDAPVPKRNPMSTSAASLTPSSADVTLMPASAPINTERSPKRVISAPAGRPPSVAPAPIAASTIEVVPSGRSDRVRYSGSTGDEECEAERPGNHREVHRDEQPAEHTLKGGWRARHDADGTRCAMWSPD